MIDEDAIRTRWDAVGSKLDERGRRLFAAGEVRTAGWGGLAVVSRITGLARESLKAAAFGADRLDQAGRLLVHAPLPLRGQAGSREKPGGKRLIVFRERRVEGKGGTGGRAHQIILWVFSGIYEDPGRVSMAK